MVSSMVAVGESTGTLDETLAKVTEIYDEEIDNSINAMMSMIEPLMIVVIGGVVGIILQLQCTYRYLIWPAQCKKPYICRAIILFTPSI